MDASIMNQEVDSIFERARRGNVDAQLKMARIYADPTWSSKYDDLALDWYITAAKSGCEDAQLELGLFYFRLPEQSNYESEGLKWLKLSAQSKRFAAVVALRDASEFAIIRASAKTGRAYAIELLASLYYHGTSVVKRDLNEAARLYTIAAEAGDRESAHKLACIYEEWKDFATAIQWYLRFLELHKPPDWVLRDICMKLGDLYSACPDIENSRVEAINWYLRSLKLHTPPDWALKDICMKLGDLYSACPDIENSRVEAIKWYIKGAECGDYNSISVLISLFENGEIFEESVGALIKREIRRRLNPLGKEFLSNLPADDGLKISTFDLVASSWGLI